jgi:leader peptidase (prepilin peptidase)/N-methyltransferase
VQISVFISYVTVAAFGLVFGSFLNVCIARLPRQESIITPRSHCPRCGRPIRWYDNIPVLSFLLLGGRCRDCRERISLIYPAVEVLTAVILLAAFARYAFSPDFVKYAVLGMLLLILIFTDLTARRIPHAVTLLGIGLGLLLSCVVPVDNRPLEWLLGRIGFYPGETFASVLGSLAGALVGGGVFYATGRAFYYLGGRKKEYLGFGDVMLMLMVGAFLGVPLTLVTMLLGSLLGSLTALPLEIATRRFRGYPWPYGSFLGMAAIYASLGGQALLDAYLRWSHLAG